jgi:hypothetical protein
MSPLLRAAPHLFAEAGISERKARALIRLERARECAPGLIAAFREGRLSWVQASALVRLVTLPEAAPHEAEWIARAQQVTVRRLYDDVDAALEAIAAGTAPSPPADDSGVNWQTSARLPDSARGNEPPDETSEFSFVAPIGVARFLRAVIASVRKRFGCTEGEAWRWIFDHALEAWGANDPHVEREHRVFARDGWRCTIPGCSSYRNLQDHHVVFRAAGGEDDLTNRTTLCAYHHLRGVHAGRVRVLGSAPDQLRFELGLRRGLPPLLAYRSGELCAG